MSNLDFDANALAARTVVDEAPPLTEPDYGFVRNVWDELQNSWWMQTTQSLFEGNVPAEEGFDPLTDERMAGKGMYANYLRTAKSSAEFDAVWQRLKDYEERRMRLAEDGGIAASLVAGIIDPTNLLPIGIATRGAGALRGMVTGSASLAAINAGLGVVQNQVAPVSDDEIYYSALMGAGFGTVLGGIVGRGVPDNVRLTGLAREIEAKARAAAEAREAELDRDEDEDEPVYS